MSLISTTYPSPEEVLSEDFLSKYRGKQPNWGFNGLGYVVYKRTYSRRMANGKFEEWSDTVERCVRGAQKIGAKLTKEEAERLYHYVFNLKSSFSGRCLWLLGTPTVDRFGANGLVNCWFSTLETIEDFCFVFENLMLGGGVGASVRRENVHQFPKIKTDIKIINLDTKDADFIVPDSREGWIELLRRVLTAFFETGKSFSYSTILVRKYGEIINGFGGTASGPQILIDGINNICKVLSEREGKRMRSIDALHIFNIIASIVVAGNVRRSSEIALGDADDMLFLRAKRWDLGNIPNWAAMSNNTITADSYDYITPEFWKGYEINAGECYGLFNLSLCQKFGRLIDGPMRDAQNIYPVKRDGGIGTNPCSEILPLFDGECCNLSEQFLNNIESQEELEDSLILHYKVNKAICAMPFLHEKTNKIVHKNMRIGMGVTGICQSKEKLAWLDPAYKSLRKFDKAWSKKNGWPESIKLTTVKPSGTLSLLAGSTPGVHPAYSKNYIRRVRMADIDPTLEYCRQQGFPIEDQINFDGSSDSRTKVVSFPCQSDGIIAKEMSAVDQLELVKELQTIWADNGVSCTIYFKQDDLPHIKSWLEKNYASSIKSVSFLRHSDHGFIQAPYEEITEEQYNKLAKNISEKKEILEIADYINEVHSDCAGGACPVR